MPADRSRPAGHGASVAAPQRPDPVPRGLADRIIRELGDWLEGAATAGTRAAAGGVATDPRARTALRRLISAHGLASHLVRDLAAADVVAGLPNDLQAWLTASDADNRLRIDRMLAELATALRALGRAGIPVMPVKGALLATRPGTDPYRRPMADLDLLVRPVDLDGARAALEDLGYRRRPEGNRRPTHDTFEEANSRHVVSMTSEHPDNPRPIELHTEVKRHLWAWMDDDDLTRFLWAGANEGTIVGEPAVVPSDLALLGHLAIHATSDLLVGRGRLIQLVDVAEAAGRVVAAGAGHAIASLPHPRLALPSLRLAARRLPGRMAALPPDDLTRLEVRVSPRLSRWAARVPLDTRAGLQSGRLLAEEASSPAARWGRWAPYPWRLMVAYGEAPLPIAAARHAFRVISAARRRPL